MQPPLISQSNWKEKVGQESKVEKEVRMIGWDDAFRFVTHPIQQGGMGKVIHTTF